MYCLLITGVPAAGKSTLAEVISNHYHLPMISKDTIKEIMFDDIGFHSREEKVQLGVASMNIMYCLAGQLMKNNQPFILENNFENSSKDGIVQLLEQYAYTAITITVTGSFPVIYQRFIERDQSPSRHRGHVVNDCYPEREPKSVTNPITHEAFVDKIRSRGMDRFVANGPQIIVDTTDYNKVNYNDIIKQIDDELHRIK